MEYGAAVGSYRVSVSDALPPKNAPVAAPVVSLDGLAVETANEKSGGNPIAVFVPQTRIAARYARFAESTLTIEVPAKGLDSWKLELTAD